jgi:hypothetical protein
MQKRGTGREEEKPSLWGERLCPHAPRFTRVWVADFLACREGEKGKGREKGGEQGEEGGDKGREDHTLRKPQPRSNDTGAAVASAATCCLVDRVAMGGARTEEGG